MEGTCAVEDGWVGISSGGAPGMHVCWGDMGNYKCLYVMDLVIRVQELCESQGGRPGLPILMSLTVSVDVKQH